MRTWREMHPDEKIIGDGTSIWFNGSGDAGAGIVVEHEFYIPISNNDEMLLYHIRLANGIVVRHWWQNVKECMVDKLVLL